MLFTLLSLEGDLNLSFSFELNFGGLILGK